MRTTKAFLIASLALVFCGHLVAEDQRPRFSLRQADAPTGSNIKRSVVQESVIPFDKRYSELTPEQQGYLKSQYEKMGPADEPPYPLNGTKSIYRAIATVQQRLMVDGDLSLAVDIDSHGEPTAVSVLHSPDPQMTKHIAAILLLEKYKPAVCDGTPCAMQFPIRATLKKQL